MEITYPLDKLADQLQKSETLRLNYEGGVKSEATINVNLQWVYSKSKFYTNIISMLDKDINREHETQQNAQDSLRSLYELFPSTANALPRQVKFSSLDRFREFSPVVSANEPTLGKAGKDADSYTTFIMYFCILLLLVGLFISYLKAQFLDVGFVPTQIGLAALFITSTMNGVPRMTRKMGLIFSGLIILSLILDFVWWW